MKNSKWSELKSLVESSGFQKHPGFNQIIANAYSAALKEVSYYIWAQNKDRLTKEWLVSTLADYGIKLKARNRPTLINKAVPRLHEKGQLQNFKKKIALLKDGKAKKESEERANNLYRSTFQGPQAAKKYSKEWFIKLCKNNNIKVNPKARRDILFKHALSNLYELGLEKELEEAIKKLDETPPELSEDRIQQIYDELCGHDVATTLKLLERHFPDIEGFEQRFKEFIFHTGIEQSGSGKRSNWLKRVAEELSNDHGGAKLLLD